MAVYEPLEKRFWRKVEKTGTCWLWTGAKFENGYGAIWTNPDTQRAHRVSWELNCGKIPLGLIVCHKCDNPPCVRPDHLFLGTLSDNRKDMVQKRRGMVGALNIKAVLTEEQVFKLRGLRDKPFCVSLLAQEYGVSKNTISRAMSGETWSYLNG